MCCWACVPCKKHEYMVSYKECADCGAGKWPHENRTSCYELPAKVSDTHSFLITLIYHHHDMAIPVVEFSREGYKIRNLGMVMRILVFFIFGLFSYFHQLLNTIQLEYTRHQNVWSRWPLVQVACF